MSHSGGAERQEAATSAEAVEAAVEVVGPEPRVETVEPTAKADAVATRAQAVEFVRALPESVVTAPPPAIVSAVAPAPYSTSGLAAEFRQGEIITGLEQVVRITDGNAEVKQHPFAIVLSQDCDLAADHRARQGAGGVPVMNGILLLEAFPLDGFFRTLGFGSKERKQVQQYGNARYHTLEAAAEVDDLEAQGYTALAIDFRRYFTLTADDMAGQLSLTARRRSRLVSPYVEHLQSRAMHYLGRVALPDRD